jgi:hypothetical protein
MAFSRETWNQAKLYYEAGVAPKIICQRLGVTQSQICRRSVSEGWMKGLSINKESLPDELTSPLKNIESKLADAVLEKKLCRSDLTKEELYLVHSKACQTQLELLGLIMETRAVISTFVKEHADGKYEKKDGEKETIYGLVSEVCGPIATMLNATAIFTHDKRGISVTNNTQINQNSDQPMPATAPIIIEFNGK